MEVNSVKVKHPPLFCPNCGKKTLRNVECSDGYGALVYDSYCTSCQWSGDISPDSDLRYFKETK